MHYIDLFLVVRPRYSSDWRGPDLELVKVTRTCPRKIEGTLIKIRVKINDNFLVPEIIATLAREETP